ncbi:hypothetical protein MMC28_001979 [Mycoblastus sanguinarius]|nr:hypothetical protein [Mycoblastus sanguinarius]
MFTYFVGDIQLQKPIWLKCLSLIAEKTFDLQYSLPMTIKEKSNYEIHPEPNLEDDLDFFNSGMAGTGNSSPFIKDEPEEFSFLPQNYTPSHRGYNMQNSQPFGDGHTGNVDPSDLAMQNGNFSHWGSNPHQNMSNSFNFGKSGINDDELLDLDLNDTSHQHNTQNGQNGYDNIQTFFPNQGQSGSIATNGQSHMNHMYSSTPDGAPIQSPFTHDNFNYAQFAHMQSQQQMSHASPGMRPNPLNTQNSYMARSRSSAAPAMDRQTSDSRSPMTPKTPGMGALHLGTPESGSLPSQPIRTNFSHSHQKNLSSQWDSTPGSFLDSPMSSPGQQANHAQISEILKSGKHASLPAKVENGHHPAPAYQTQEAKKRRRRESHNMVERRRRDNINEKIQELSHLVPMHRLEDEKVRKHILNNSPLSPTLTATGRSPPQATSLLAGGGRRATGAGSISMGIPPEEKDKGPNKGDILNGSVSWTRDLMWALHIKIQQEDHLAELITNLGGTWPFEQSEEEKRMRTELLTAVADNNPETFTYTRGPGSGLRVPTHTNAAGEPINQGQIGTLSPQSLSPGQQSGGSGGHGQQQYWNFKEEDEYGMEMN